MGDKLDWCRKGDQVRNDRKRESKLQVLLHNCQQSKLRWIVSTHKSKSLVTFQRNHGVRHAAVPRTRPYIFSPFFHHPSSISSSSNTSFSHFNCYSTFICLLFFYFLCSPFSPWLALCQDASLVACFNQWQRCHQMQMRIKWQFDWPSGRTCYWSYGTWLSWATNKRAAGQTSGGWGAKGHLQ